MASQLKLGVIGMSKGNGHPYSWSAIINGFDAEKMKDCPFPVIPQYLAVQNFPGDFLNTRAKVSHIWTQDKNVSEHIASCSKIDHVVDNIGDLIAQVDGVLLARDDAENHMAMALPFIEAGMPVFVDKPFALSVKDAETMFRAQRYNGQVFTCSALRYAQELQLTSDDRHALRSCAYAEGTVMKEWDTYAVHVIEPLINQLPDRGKLITVTTRKISGIHISLIEWQNFLACIRVTGTVQVPLALTYFGEEHTVTKSFTDAFGCFRKSLNTFIDGMHVRKPMIDKEETLEIVSIIEKGR